jgi:DNA ligase (NAD+)
VAGMTIAQAPHGDRELASLTPDELAEVIRFHNERYWQADAPVIPDQDYDQLVERLRRSDPLHPALSELGAGAAPSTGDKVSHDPPMLSLGKCYSEQELHKWAKAYDGLLVASPKIDGAACSIRYSDEGRLLVAGTRGDGGRGENITHNVIGVPNVPTQLPSALMAARGACEVRGEVFMSLSNFAAVSELFANPRNVAAGSLKAKEQGAVAADQLSFFAYDLLGWELGTEKEKHALLVALGFTPAPMHVCDVGGAQAVYDAILATRDAADYEMDGVVFKIDDFAEQGRRGFTAHHPRWALAYKFQGDSGQSTLLEVLWSVSRTGTITPVAIVEPVELSGAMVTRATLHNLSNVKSLELKLGDTLLMTRRGGVIPHVEGTKGGGSVAIEHPAACPECGSSTEIRSSMRRVAGEDIETSTLHCSAPNECPAVLRGILGHYTKVLEIDGFGDKIIDMLLARRLVKDPAGLYTLTVDDLRQLPRLGQTSAENLLAKVQSARRVELATFLVALGIDTLGKHAAGLIASRWTLAELRTLNESELAELHSLGDITAQRIVHGLADLAPMIDRLLDHIVVFTLSTEASDDALMAGQTVIFTGALQRMTRRDAQQLVTRLGGKAGSSVTKDTTLIVVGGDGLSAAKPSSKLKKAHKLIAGGQALELISEDDFLARIA